MDPQGRVCELDINDPHRVLVYVTPEVRAMRLQQDMAHNKEGLDEMLWSQPLLYEISQKGTCRRRVMRAPWSPQSGSKSTLSWQFDL